MPSSKREEWIDILRGLAVFMVILGHLYKGYPYHLIANPIKMPVFYFIAGYVASMNKPIWQIISNRGKGLFIPMIIFSLFPVRVLYYLIMVKNVDVARAYIMGFVDGSINWFIYSFFVSSVLFVCLYKLVRGNTLAFAIASMICFAIGILTRDVAAMNIWSMNTALTSILFMFVGLEFRIQQWKNLSNRWAVIACTVLYCLLLGVSVIFYKGEKINYHHCSYYSLPICIAMIMSGFVFLRYSFIKLCENWKGETKKFFISFGQNTIVIYLASSTFNALVISGFKRFLGTDSPNFYVCFVGAIISCMLGYILSIFCRKYFPLLLGIQRKD